MKHYIKRDKNTPHKCSEACSFINQDVPTIKWEHSGVMIGSGFCQRCEHHKNNNLKESIGDYNINTHGGSLTWIECDKLSN